MDDQCYQPFHGTETEFSSERAGGHGSCGSSSSTPEMGGRMRNDARPIGEEFRDIAEHDEQGSSAANSEAEGACVTPESKPFVIRHDPAEPPPDASDR
jgi:hypothetical protein